jgi:hypothetical protein
VKAVSVFFSIFWSSDFALLVAYELKLESF